SVDNWEGGAPSGSPVTPLTVNGTFTANASTVNFTGTSATTIPALTYYHLGFLPASGSPTHTLAAGTITAGGNLTVGDGTNAVTVNATANDPAITVAGNFSVASGTYTASDSAALTIGGNFTNNGTFTHSNGTVVFNDNSKTSALAYNAATTFRNLTVATGGKQMQFDNADQTNVTGMLTLQGSGCGVGRVLLDSTVNDDQWALNATGTTTLQYLDVEDG